MNIFFSIKTFIQLEDKIIDSHFYSVVLQNFKIEQLKYQDNVITK